MSPRDASGMPNFAWSAATTMSQLIRISKPPASAEPLAAAMSGLGKSRSVMPAEALVGDRELAGGEGLQVHAGGEGLVVGAGEDDDPDVVVALAVVERVAEGERGRAVDGVARFGSVDGEYLDVSASFA